MEQHKIVGLFVQKSERLKRKPFFFHPSFFWLAIVFFTYYSTSFKAKKILNFYIISIDFTGPLYIAGSLI